VHHQVGVGIEGFTSIILEKLKISKEMYDKEENQEQPGKAHDQFSTG
jgi:hypothetical protein